MALAGRLHPLLVHFPIALVLVAAVAELVAMLTSFQEWRVVAVANVRAAAVFAMAAGLAGWLLASSSSVEPSDVLEWHRWIGTAATVAVVAAALATSGHRNYLPGVPWLFRIALFWAAALVAVTSHLGGTLVWGADFLLRP
jgi:uncharacterized membrane protein